MTVTIGEINRQLKSALSLGKANLRKKGVEVADDATIYGIMGAIERIPFYSSANNRGYSVSILMLKEVNQYCFNVSTKLENYLPNITYIITKE